jgi:hypothetical protein
VTQWHPLFARLLRPLVEGQYDVQTNVAVGDAPREADLLLLRRLAATAAPFQGLWQWLTIWNVVEFKGPTASARVGDLDLLIELGLGIDRRLNEERAKQEPVPREEMSFWYLAPHLGRRFLRDARGLVGELEVLAAGVWRARLLRRSLLLVSNRELAVERDSVPIHLVAKEPMPNAQALANLLGSQLDLWNLSGSWIVASHPALWEEIQRMARAKTKGPTVDINRLVEVVGMQELIRQVGLKRIVDESGIDALLSQLSPEQRQEMLRRLQETQPAGEQS